MASLPNKMRDSKTKVAANTTAQLRESTESCSYGDDRRAATVVQKRQRDMAASGHQVRQMSTYQQMANNSQQVAQLKATAPGGSAQQIIQRRENTTGLPDNLKSGIENLSGVSMDDVKVHYNSSKPAQLQALAYAQGTDIHIGPGQEKHLPHEAWHVVQQKMGRVRPTMQMKSGVAVNDDGGLEREADMMGAVALKTTQRMAKDTGDTPARLSGVRNNTHQLIQGGKEVIQRRSDVLPNVPAGLVKKNRLPFFKTNSQKLQGLITKYNAISLLNSDYKKQVGILEEIMEKIAVLDTKSEDSAVFLQSITSTIRAELEVIQTESGKSLESLASGVLGKKSTPFLKGITKKDTVTEFGDVTSFTQTATTIGDKGAELFFGSPEGVSAAVGIPAGIIGTVGIGLSLFGIAENAVRGRDAKIRFAAFTQAYLKLEGEGSAIAPYLKAAAKQQQWEKKRRWIRVAVNTTVSGLAIAALILGTVSTLGAGLVIAGTVLSIAKGIETIWNIRKKRNALEYQNTVAAKMLTGMRDEQAPTYAAVSKLIASLGIKLKAADIVAGNDAYTKAVKRLAPHLAREEEKAEAGAQRIIDAIDQGGDYQAAA